MKQETFEYKSTEYIIQIGQNRHDNSSMIDAASENDIWFHVEGMPSCHVILKTHETVDTPRQVIKRCAYLCKIHSKAKTLNRCVISYTTLNNVSKTNIIGQVNVQYCKTVRV